jgi:crotonobetainyl-CoA:carnitine CoA-transferase CaiB-like acyl-CoA transferase
MIAPYQAFPAADGHVMIAAGSDAIFARLAQALGAPALAADERFRDNPGRVRHRPALVAALAALTRERKAAELVAELRRHGVPSAPVLTIDAVLAEPHTRESGVLVSAAHPRLGEFTGVGLPIQWDGRRPGVRRVPPRLGQDSEDVLTWLGYTRDDVRGLRSQRVIT